MLSGTVVDPITERQRKEKNDTAKNQDGVKLKSGKELACGHKYDDAHQEKSRPLHQPPPKRCPDPKRGRQLHKEASGPMSRTSPLKTMEPHSISSFPRNFRRRKCRRSVLAVTVSKGRVVIFCPHAGCYVPSGR